MEYWKQKIENYERLTKLVNLQQSAQATRTTLYSAKTHPLKHRNLHIADPISKKIEENFEKF